MSSLVAPLLLFCLCSCGGHHGLRGGAHRSATVEACARVLAWSILPLL